MKTLQEKALEAHRQKIETSEFKMFKELREIQSDIESLRRRVARTIPGTPEYRRNLEAQALVRSASRFDRTLGKLLKEIFHDA